MKNTALQAEINTIPKNWEVVKLEDIIASFHNGIWGDDPLPNLISYPVIRSTEITCDGKIDLSTVAFRKIPEDKVNKFTLDDGDILLVASSGSPDLIGRAALFRQPDDDRVYLFSNFMLRIRSQTIDQNFLFYVLSSQHYYHFLKSLQQTSTGLRNLPKKNFLNFTIPYPPLAEQHKIDEILGTVDEAIEKVDKAIEKTKRLKKGLMQVLLTKGIGHKEFKDTEIGRIPKEWEVVKLGDVALDFISGGTPCTKNPAYWNGPIPWMTSAHIDRKVIVDGMQNITDEGVRNSATNIVPACSILMATRVGIGKVAINSVDIAISQDLTGVVLDRKKINVEYAYWLLSSITAKLSRLSQGSTIKGLLRDEIKRIEIPLPNIFEQKEIVEILNNVDKRLEMLKERNRKIEKIKKGLMNDLLTGGKRIMAGGEI